MYQDHHESLLSNNSHIWLSSSVCVWVMNEDKSYINLYSRGSQSTFKGPNLNFHQCQRSGPKKLVIAKIKIHNLHNKSTIYIYIYIYNLIKCPLHSKYINNKCKSGKTINLSVRGRPIWGFLATDGQYMMLYIWYTYFLGPYIWPNPRKQL